ncbi:hypothetical protein FFLO_07030 [Filobasidium floriforme]|uniref:Uncharacterized protein n=1 Tax=Filobasidium floriforme TaxID=5210 RepID=A0A8K0JJE7_9TREE|nr:uncharacterized protein HD553DRAFT_341324 [Filobasidium floriforme]KAG7527341.1 hypothetical protein FFLO_07030 [Filobasidium floriforme]KAH8086491.1 hypothetical protein HD553DRAFT_341324 [Filobasidium floriforme]
MDYEHLSREELLAELRKAGPPIRIKQETVETTHASVKTEADVIVLDADLEESPVEDEYHDDVTERKRKRDPDTPKKKKRPPPQLRQSYSPSQYTGEDSSSPAPVVPRSRLPRQSRKKYFDPDDFSTDSDTNKSQSETPSDNRPPRAAKDKARDCIMTLTQVINGPDWNNAAVSSPTSATEEHLEPSDLEPTPTASLHAKLTKLPRFIQNSTCPENLVTAVRSAFQKVVDDFPDHITKSERNLAASVAVSEIKLLAGDHQCKYCFQKSNQQNNAKGPKPPPEMQRIPCLSLGEGRPCIPCAVLKQGCSFTEERRKADPKPPAVPSAQSRLQLEPRNDAPRASLTPTASTSGSRTSQTGTIPTNATLTDATLTDAASSNTTPTDTTPTDTTPTDTTPTDTTPTDTTPTDTTPTDANPTHTTPTHTAPTPTTLTDAAPTATTTAVKTGVIINEPAQAGPSSAIARATAPQNSVCAEEVTWLKKRLVRKMGESCEFFNRSLEAIHPGGRLGDAVEDTLKEMARELQERLRDTEELLKEVKKGRS